jgi:Zn-dependent metalloprotease
VGIIASSFAVPAYAVEKKGFIPKVTAIDSYDNPTFVIGELSEKSGDSPEKVVEKNYSRKFNGSGSMKQKSFKQSNKIKNSMGRTVISTSQTFNGVRVYGSEQNYHINDNGVLECVAGSSVNDIENKVISKSFSAKYSQNDVLNVIEKHLGFKPDYSKTPQPEIILYPVGGKYHYAYEVEVKSSSPYYTSCTYYIDAGNLSVIKANNNICSAEQPVDGTGVGQFNTNKPLKIVRNDNGTYSLKNTYENFGTYYADQSLKGVAFLDLYTGNDNSFNSGINYEKDAVDAHSNITKAAKYFNSAPFYRNGNDNKGSYSYVGIILTGIDSKPNGYADVNHFSFNTIRGSAGRSTSACLDIAVHEYAHGIMLSQGIKYAEKEGMAIHEGVADVFGILGEHFIANDGSTDDWYMGEDMGQYLRDCTNPQIDDYNDYIAYASNTPYDQHVAGGIITKAASLMAKGGTHNGVSVSNIDYGKIARIFYNAINDNYFYNINNLSFKQFANFTLQSAYLLYGANSQAYRSTRDAFTAVGLLDASPKSFRLIHINDMKVQLAWDTKSGSKVGVYRKIAGKKDEPVLINTTANTTGLEVSTLTGSMEFYAAFVDQSNNRISPYTNAVNIEKLTKSAPTNFKKTYVSGTSIQFSWSGTTGDRFAVYRKISGTSDEFEKVGETTSKQISVETLLGKCDFKVAVISSSGTRLSAFSNVVAVETYLYAPGNFKLKSSTSSTATFSWDQVSDYTYAIYRSRTGTSDLPEKVIEGSVNCPTVQTISGTYDYQVAIVDFYGNRISEFSNIVVVQR